jgi:hypothetical protein
MSTFTAGLWAFAARKLADWAELFRGLSEAGQEPAEPEPDDSAFDETGPTESGAPAPPADWLARLESGGPPAHWLELLRNGDPEWMEGSPSRPPADAPSPSAPFEPVAAGDPGASRPAPAPLRRAAVGASSGEPGDAAPAPSEDLGGVASAPSEDLGDVAPEPSVKPAPSGRPDRPHEPPPLTVEPERTLPARPAASSQPARRRLSFGSPPAPPPAGTPAVAPNDLPSVRVGAGPSPRVEPARPASPAAAPTVAHPASPVRGSGPRMEIEMNAAPASRFEPETPVAALVAPATADPLPAGRPDRPAAPAPPVASRHAALAARTVALEARKPAPDAAASTHDMPDAPPAIDDRWPALPEDPSGPAEDWALSWRAWERRRRLDREQRGT